MQESALGSFSANKAARGNPSRPATSSVLCIPSHMSPSAAVPPPSTMPHSNNHTGKPSSRDHVTIDMQISTQLQASAEGARSEATSVPVIRKDSQSEPAAAPHLVRKPSRKSIEQAVRNLDMARQSWQPSNSNGQMVVHHSYKARMASRLKSIHLGNPRRMSQALKKTRNLFRPASPKRSVSSRARSPKPEKSPRRAARFRASLDKFASLVERQGNLTKPPKIKQGINKDKSQSTPGCRVTKHRSP